MKTYRIIAASLPQFLILLYEGGRLDLLFGLNRTDHGLTLLLLLFVVAPFNSLAWLIVEIIAARSSKTRTSRRSWLTVGAALLVFIESIVIDLYLLLQVKM